MDNRKVALITGITGQDGSYLAELLLEKGYDVHGTIRRSSTDYRERIAHLEGKPNFHLHYADLGDSMSIIQVMNKVKPTEVYNLAAQSHVQVSFDSPEFTADVDATGVLRILEAIRQCGLEKTCRMYQSERRGETFVTRKITLAAARIKQGKQEKLYLGNLDSLRDWGYAKDYVECMWLILQAEKPEDFVIATGKQHSVREFAQLAFHHVGIELKWEGKDENEKGICVEGPENLIGKTLVEVSPDFYRPTDVVNLWGDPTKAKAKLNWNPNTTSFEELVKIMVESDMAKVAAEDAGQKVRCNLVEYLEKGIVK